MSYGLVLATNTSSQCHAATFNFHTWQQQVPCMLGLVRSAQIVQEDGVQERQVVILVMIT
eukprot:5350376-Amphidinium_carterae.1